MRCHTMPCVFVAMEREINERSPPSSIARTRLVPAPGSGEQPTDDGGPSGASVGHTAPVSRDPAGQVASQSQPSLLIGIVQKGGQVRSTTGTSAY